MNLFKTLAFFRSSVFVSLSGSLSVEEIDLCLPRPRFASFLTMAILAFCWILCIKEWTTFTREEVGNQLIRICPEFQISSWKERGCSLPRMGWGGHYCRFFSSASCNEKRSSIRADSLYILVLLIRGNLNTITIVELLKMCECCFILS